MVDEQSSAGHAVPLPQYTADAPAHTALPPGGYPPPGTPKVITSRLLPTDPTSPHAFNTVTGGAVAISCGNSFYNSNIPHNIPNRIVTQDLSQDTQTTQTTQTTRTTQTMQNIQNSKAVTSTRSTAEVQANHGLLSVAQSGHVHGELSTNSTAEIQATAVKTRIVIISDTHHLSSNWPDLHDTSHAFRKPLPNADILLHTGDLTIFGLFDQNVAAVDMLKSAPAELKIVIPGNHDVTLDTEYYSRGVPHMHDPELYPQDVDAIRDLYTGQEAYAAGIRYMEEGVQSFTLANGAKFTVYASAYTPEFCGWAFAYEREWDRYNPAHPEVKYQSKPVPNWPTIDIMLTHGPPKGVMDEVVIKGKLSGEHVGCDNLMNAVRRCRPRLHAFGHIHEGWGMEKWNWSEKQGKGKCVKSWYKGSDTEDDPVTWVKDGGRFVDLSNSGGGELNFGEDTIFVNASIMNVDYSPVNAPWVVDLDLPLSKMY